MTLKVAILTCTSLSDPIIEFFVTPSCGTLFVLQKTPSQPTAKYWPAWVFIFDRVLDPLLQWHCLSLNASPGGYDGTQAPKEPYLASGRFVVDGSFRMACFPRGRNSKSLSNTGVCMCISQNACICSRGSCLSLFGDPANLW